jgi:phosphogluconate dehydratase
MARAAGVIIDWDDFAELSTAVPLIVRIYPNGNADVNHFHAAGGTAFVVGELIDNGLVHGDVLTIAGPGLARYCEELGLSVRYLQREHREVNARSTVPSLRDGKPVLASRAAH